MAYLQYVHSFLLCAVMLFDSAFNVQIYYYTDILIGCITHLAHLFVSVHRGS